MIKQNLIEIISNISGKLLQNDFNLIKEAVLLSEQRLILKEDMLQIEFSNGLLLDVGWYSKPNGKGNFTIYVIQNFDWENPLIKKRCYSIKTLKKEILNTAHWIANRPSTFH